MIFYFIQRIKLNIQNVKSSFNFFEVLHFKLLQVLNYFDLTTVTNMQYLTALNYYIYFFSFKPQNFRPEIAIDKWHL